MSKAVDADSGKLSDILGLYKAEWLSNKLFDLFTEPGYFSELKTSRPCVLIGGRGTGKTTVLKGLSYEGQLSFADGNKDIIDTWGFFGIYHRVNTNRVTAFRGPELSEEQWSACFAHYLNLLFCSQLFEFASWYERQTGRGLTLTDRDFLPFKASLGLRSEGNLRELAHELRLEVLKFEASINSVRDEPPANLSMQAAPVDALAQTLLSCKELKGKQFFFLIDEFENFEDYQQRILNTIIKHSPSEYTFKIGVRELGWRERATLNSNEQLTSPADYARISIAERLDDNKFKHFAERVLAVRFSNVTTEPLQPSILFPRLTETEEVGKLLDRAEISRISQRIRSAAPQDQEDAASSLPLSVQFFLTYWVDSHPEISLSAEIKEWLAGSTTARARYENHFYASLFSIRRGKRGIRKYYSGWDVMLSLCAGNIRYVLELVHLAVTLHIDKGGDPFSPIDPETQTEAAQLVGRKNLSELEGLSVDGARLTKLLLSLGRVFGVLAESPGGHTPEANQFHLREDAASGENDDKAMGLLKHAVMHLALVRFSGSKALDERDTRAYDYMIHPIFAPFFVFSHRKKRKIKLTSSQLLALVDRPREGIDIALKSNNRNTANVLPDQLDLFSEFYA